LKQGDRLRAGFFVGKKTCEVLFAKLPLIGQINGGLGQLAAVPGTILPTTCGALFVTGIIPTTETTIWGFE